jgi:hypothetical protein
MRKLYTLLFLLIGFGAKAQWVSIPDTNFAKAVIARTSTICFQGNSTVGWQMDTTCIFVTLFPFQLVCDSLDIHDVEGIQYLDSCVYFALRKNPIVTISHLPKSLLSLTLWDNPQLNTIAYLPQRVQGIQFVSNHSLTTLPPLPASLIYMDVSDNALISLPALPDSLQQLDCHSNQLTSLPAINDSLQSLNCSYNQISILPSFGNNLNGVICRYNLLSNLTGLNDSIRILDCRNNHLSSLPSLPISLEYLGCDTNRLISLPALPDSLSFISCSANQLTALPALPASLHHLECSGNNLTALPVLPNNLWTLGCGNNPLNTLPVLPANLSSLDCPNIGLTSLPMLPNNMDFLNCDNNQLTTLPPFPIFYWGEISCRGNNLSSLPELPDTLYSFYCDSNPNLLCLPEIKYVEELSFTNCGITCIPNFGTVYHSVPSLDSVPLCGIFNSNGCNAYWNISGKTYFDNNADCIAETSDMRLKNIKLQLWSGGILDEEIYSGNQGLYSFDLDSFGNYEVKIDTLTTPHRIICPVNGSYQDTITVTDSLDYGQDFSFACKPGFDITAWSISTWSLVTGNYATIAMGAGDISNFYGVHCAAGISGAVTVTINGPASYSSPASGALTPSSVSGNLLTYNIANFGAVNFNSDFNFIVQTDTTAPIGSQVCFTVSVTPTAGDNNPSNNTLTHCFTVVNSYDPNEKEVYPSGDIDTAQKWLTYTINFQNTGTAEAQHIYVTDTLDSDIDASSFQLLAYSHQPMVQIKENVVRFNFPNINLPDSNTNEPLSHGYVQYKVKLKDNLPIGTHISNTAYIYFDFNSPVVTNTTTNTISTTTAIQSIRNPNSEIRIYPNPATNELNISLGGLQAEQVRLYSADGRLLSEVHQPVSNRIDISHLAAGIYIAEVISNKETIRKRWVKM